MRSTDSDILRSYSPATLGIWDDTPKVSMNRITLLRLVVRKVSAATDTLREDARKVTHATG
jgi:hypothetical protein